MSNHLTEAIAQIAQNPKVAIGVSTATAGTGAGMILDWIPTDIGKVATVVGIVLSIVLIRVHLMTYKQSKLNAAKTELEIEIIKRKEEERRDAAQKRTEAGEPCRRQD